MNICRRCGACCTCYRVSFYWYEASDHIVNPVPAELTQRVDRFRIAMQRRHGNTGACVALSGIVGTWVYCRIYDRRPSICRNFRISYEYGAGNPLCDNARRKLGLPPIGPDSVVMPSPDESIRNTFDHVDGEAYDYRNGKHGNDIPEIVCPL